MIFISHNYKDKAIVESIAMRLSSIFGQEKVFYDSWSIQPGDGIIDKMNEGLSNCKVFLFFVSNNSLNSNMVKLEWQNAIMKMTNGQTKIIPVRLDNCMMPTILLQSLYIDLFQNGMEVAIRQIVDVSSGNNTFTPQFTEISNLVAYKSWECDKLIVECVAQYYMDPITRFLFATENTEDQILYKVRGVSIAMTGFSIGQMENSNGTKLNSVNIVFPQCIIPGYSQILEISAVTDAPIDIVGVLHEKQRDKWEMIPMINK